MADNKKSGKGLFKTAESLPPPKEAILGIGRSKDKVFISKKNSDGEEDGKIHFVKKKTDGEDNNDSMQLAMAKRVKGIGDD
ncbi:hypothetical protein [Sphingomonas aurantiaca]|uniref:hypothetical protein n=1 Tax=Sphingomonas aurantiaca TaxID=185949 RepID=UPI0033583A5C